MTNVVLPYVRPGRGGSRPGSGRPKGAKSNPTRVLDRIDSAKKAAPSAGGVVYLLEEVDCGTICKVGIARDPAARLSAHQVSNWRRLRLAAIFDCSSPRLSVIIERHILSKFRAHSVSGEWIHLPSNTVAEEIERFCADNKLKIVRCSLSEYLTAKSL